MTLRRPGAFGGAAAVVLVLLTAACGGGTKGGTPSAKVKKLGVSLPSALAGLSVQPETNTSQLASAGLSTYVRAVSLYSLRQKDLVKATLQVSEFNDSSKFRSSKFQRTLVNQIAHGAPVTVRVGGSTVYLTSGVKQSVAVWFHDRYFLVLTTRADFDRPRTLLRSVIEVPL